MFAVEYRCHEPIYIYLCKHGVLGVVISSDKCQACVSCTVSYISPPPGLPGSVAAWRLTAGDARDLAAHLDVGNLPVGGGANKLEDQPSACLQRGRGQQQRCTC